MYASVVNDQLDAQFFFLIRLFQFPTCFNCFNTINSPDDDHEVAQNILFSYMFISILCHVEN
jgi:hypothetical protein